MTLHVRIQPIPNASPDSLPAPPLPFVPGGASVILGEGDRNQLAIPLEPSATSFFGPRGVCLVRENGPLWVSDTGHHRVLGWQQCPTSDDQPADWVIGQPDFNHEGQNAKGPIGPATLNVPTGICACGEGLAIADAWNHRILIWHHLPEDHNVPADVVLGQANFEQGEPNRGQMEAGGDRLHWPYGVLYHQGKLFVADTGNRRVLIWNQLPQENGQPADVVLGQTHFNCRDENGGGTATASSMRWPHSITIWQGNLVISDAGNNRVMIWNGIPTETNAPCAVVLGQAQFDQVELNRGVYFPTATSLNMPYGAAAIADWLLVADTANSRCLGWRYPEGSPHPPLKRGASGGSAPPLSRGAGGDLPQNLLTTLQDAAADGLMGQTDFRSKGENRSYGLPLRDSLCWPYGIQVCGKVVAIADSGNNRILLWRWQ